MKATKEANKPKNKKKVTNHSHNDLFPFPLHFFFFFFTIHDDIGLLQEVRLVVREEVTVGANVGAVDEKEEATQLKLKEATYGEEKEAHLSRL